MAERRFLGRSVRYFSSTHERSHLLCTFGMSDLPKGTPCYALVWEGAIGAFYEIDPALNITLISNVMNQPGNRYASVYGLADPTFPKNAPFSRFSDAGKLMALASFSTRGTASPEDEELISFLLSTPDIPLDLYEALKSNKYYNAGIDDTEFRNFVGIFSDRVFDTFYRFAEANMPKRFPLIIAGGCGLNCDWNTKWADSGLFSNRICTSRRKRLGVGHRHGNRCPISLYWKPEDRVDRLLGSGIPVRPLARSGSIRHS